MARLRCHSCIMRLKGRLRMHDAQSRLLNRVALVAVFGLLAVLATRQVSSLDVGFHLKAGEHLLAGNGWPDTDPFTFTVNAHPYIDTSWGYQVVLAVLERTFGPAGLVLFHAALVLAALSLLWATARLRRVRPLLRRSGQSQCHRD